jgi:hypothetical protein
MPCCAAAPPVPFEWGRNDCCTFVADAIEAMTGRDVMESVRGYSTALQAQRLAHERGGLQAAVSGLLGDPVSPALVTVGDVLLLRHEDMELLTLCNGRGRHRARAGGLATLAAPDVVAAWRVG